MYDYVCSMKTFETFTSILKTLNEIISIACDKSCKQPELQTKPCVMFNENIYF